MTKALYRNYSIGDFDKYNCVKLSFLFYLSLLFILRGYAVWVMSVTNMQDRVATLQWVYPDTRLFYLSLASGCLGLLVLFVICLRKPDAPNWVKFAWRYCRVIIITALLADLLINASVYYFWQMQSINWLLFQLGAVFFLIVLSLQSKRMKVNLQEFPENIPSS